MVQPLLTMKYIKKLYKYEGCFFQTPMGNK